MLESSIERRSARRCKELGVLCPKLVNESSIGWPDRTLFIPGGKVGFMEFKQATGRLAPAQQKWLRDLHAMGFPVCEPRSIKEAMEFLETLLSDETN